MRGSSDRRIEFIARTITDLGKALVVAGLASYFFERFPLAWRVVFSALSVVLIFAGIAMFPGTGGDD